MKFDIYRVSDRHSDRDPTRTAPPRRELPPNGTHGTRLDMRRRRLLEFAFESRVSR